MRSLGVSRVNASRTDCSAFLEKFIGGDQCVNGLLLDDRRCRRRPERVRDTGSSNVADTGSRHALGHLVGEALVRGDQVRVRDLRASKVEAVVDGMIELERDLRGAFSEMANGAEVDDVGQSGEFRQIGSWVGHLIPARLFPDGVGELGKHEFGSMEPDTTTEHKTRFIAQRLRHEPLDDNAGIDGQLHRSRSSRNRSALSLW